MIEAFSREDKFYCRLKIPCYIVSENDEENMKLFRTLLAVTLLILPISVHSASIGLIEELSFTIPKLQGEILDIDFNDINGDNIPEVLACDSSIWVLYSITGDSVVAWDSLAEIYSGFLAGQRDVKLLLEYVNSDSSADVIVARNVSAHIYDSDSSVAISMYSGASGYEIPVTKYFSGGSKAYYATQSSLGVLKFTDINNDGYKELVFSFPVTGYTSYLEGTGGYTQVYDSFPNISNTDYNLVYGGYEFKSEDKSLALIAEHYSYHSNQLGNDYIIISQQLAYIDSSGKVRDWNIEFPELPCDIYYDYIQTRKIVSIGCFGKLIPSNSELEIVIKKYSYMSCSSGQESQGSSVTEIAMMKIVSADSLEEVWSKSINEAYDNFVYLPQFPGFFCAFVDDVFTQFEGSDGSVFQATAVVPTGKREWDYPFNDSIPRLIVRNGNSISFYIADISTPVYEDNPPVLPADFRLSQPYPNPFNPQVNLSLFIPKRSEVVVKVFNIVGQQIDVLYNNVASAGELKLQWNAKDNPSGIYLIKATSGKQTSTVKAVLLK